ncbi:hypothetical protein [Streptosporangium sp. NBC_01756]|uniref:hypothetical protein n=1 Tax=Streptosporangium sp. NBC_01756 TaxID=2975950 RepID=UPI002DDC7439|nr:hypothetical protein [Streptosporangium sp. NBC_01756]WSC86389.1 hypothetical protein OIE48_39580 [Streptosporangium sp. NBC_01756]
MTGGITVQAAGADLLATLESAGAKGTWLNAATEIERSAIIGLSAAQACLGFDGHPTTIHERPAEEAVRAVLPRTVNPENPQEVAVGRLSDALAARATAAHAFTNLLLGLSAVTLLVGSIAGLYPPCAPPACRRQSPWPPPELPLFPYMKGNRMNNRKTMIGRVMAVGVIALASLQAGPYPGPSLGAEVQQPVRPSDLAHIHRDRLDRGSVAVFGHPRRYWARPVAADRRSWRWQCTSELWDKALKCRPWGWAAWACHRATAPTRAPART